MKSSIAIFAVTLAIGLSGEAAGRGITYDCDTAPGHFSELLLPAPASHFSVSGNIKVNQLASHEKWAPTARVRVGSRPSAPGAPLGTYGGLDQPPFPANPFLWLRTQSSSSRFRVLGHKTSRSALPFNRLAARNRFDSISTVAP